MSVTVINPFLVQLIAYTNFTEFFFFCSTFTGFARVSFMKIDKLLTRLDKLICNCLIIFIHPSIVLRGTQYQLKCMYQT